jgi:hypothetical protein
LATPLALLADVHRLARPIRACLAPARPADAESDLNRRTRNLLLIAALSDLYDTEPLQTHLPVANLK